VANGPCVCSYDDLPESTDVAAETAVPAPPVRARELVGAPT
jgi:hypothetical protein